MKVEARQDNYLGKDVIFLRLLLACASFLGANTLTLELVKLLVDSNGHLFSKNDILNFNGLFHVIQIYIIFLLIRRPLVSYRCFRIFTIQRS